MENNLKIGITLYLEPINYSYSSKKSISEIIKSIEIATVTSVGRKYFEVEIINDGYAQKIKFYIDTMMEYCDGYSSSFRAHFIKEDIINKLYKEEVRCKMNSVVNSLLDFDRITIDDIKKIDEILLKYHP